MKLLGGIVGNIIVRKYLCILCIGLGALLSIKQTFASAPQKQVDWEVCRSYVFDSFLTFSSASYEPINLFLVIAHHPNLYLIQQSIKEACDRKSLTFKKLLQDLYCHWDEISHTTVLSDKNEEFVCENLKSLVNKLKSVFDLSSQLITIYDLHDFQMLNPTNSANSSPLFLQLCSYEEAGVLRRYREAILKNPELYKKQINNVATVANCWYLVNGNDRDWGEAIVVTAKDREQKKKEFCNAIGNLVEQEQQRTKNFLILKKKIVGSLAFAGGLGAIGLLAWWRYWQNSRPSAMDDCLPLQGRTDAQIYCAPKELTTSGHRRLLSEIE